MRPSNRLLSVLFVACCFVALDLEAQRLAVAPEFSAAHHDLVAANAHMRTAVDTVRERVGDYRVEGTVFGALFLGALGTWMGTEACKYQMEPLEPGAGGSSQCSGLTVGLAGAALGGGLGYVLGWIMPKY